VKKLEKQKEKGNCKGEAGGHQQDVHHAGNTGRSADSNQRT